SSRQFNLSIDYIIFLDSDDFWELNCIEECIKHMSNVDIVWFDYKLHYDLEYKYAVTLFDLYKFQKDMIISSEKWLKLSFKNEISEFWFTWQGMINFKKLDDLNIYFKKGILYEDQVFGILLFGQVNSIYVLVKTLLNYRIRLNSSMNYDRETKQYSSYFNGLSKTNINNIKKSF
ncbi:glycosyltransferase, partial [Campylobacter jejuni]